MTEHGNSYPYWLERCKGGHGLSLLWDVAIYFNPTQLLQKLSKAIHGFVSSHGLEKTWMEKVLADMRLERDKQGTIWE
jgi:hypothetical protein